MLSFQSLKIRCMFIGRTNEHELKKFFNPYSTYREIYLYRIQMYVPMICIILYNLYSYTVYNFVAYKSQVDKDNIY